jgi:hypothetical protein
MHNDEAETLTYRGYTLQSKAEVRPDGYVPFAMVIDRRPPARAAVVASGPDRWQSPTDARRAGLEAAKRFVDTTPGWEPLEGP